MPNGAVMKPLPAPVVAPLSDQLRKPGVIVALLIAAAAVVGVVVAVGLVVAHGVRGRKAARAGLLEGGSGTVTPV